MYIRVPLCYLLDVHIVFTPSPTQTCDWIALLYRTPRSLENAQTHVTLLALQLPFNFIIFQTMFHLYCMTKWNYDIRIHYELTVNWKHSVQQRCKRFVATVERTIFPCSCYGRAWRWCTKQRIFYSVSPEFPYFHFSISLVKRVEYLKSVAKMWTRTYNKVFSVSSCFATPETAEVCQMSYEGG
jgi:hypothetical protein